MKVAEFKIKTDQDAYNLEAAVRKIGDDILVAIWGGEKPHIGAVAVAQPRPSLKDSRKTSASASVFCFVGHKEDDLAKAVSVKLASALNTPVVVTAGIHWDNLDAEGIQRVINNCNILTLNILEKILTEFSFPVKNDDNHIVKV